MFRPAREDNWTKDCDFNTRTVQEIRETGRNPGEIGQTTRETGAPYILATAERAFMYPFSDRIAGHASHTTKAEGATRLCASSSSKANGKGLNGADERLCFG